MPQFSSKRCPITLEDISDDNFDTSWLIVVNQTVYPLINDDCFKKFIADKEIKCPITRVTLNREANNQRYIRVASLPDNQKQILRSWFGFQSTCSSDDESPKTIPDLAAYLLGLDLLQRYTFSGLFEDPQYLPDSGLLTSYTSQWITSMKSMSEDSIMDILIKKNDQGNFSFHEISEESHVVLLTTLIDKVKEKQFSEKNLLNLLTKEGQGVYTWFTQLPSLYKNGEVLIEWINNCSLEHLKSVLMLTDSRGFSMLHHLIEHNCFAVLKALITKILLEGKTQVLFEIFTLPNREEFNKTVMSRDSEPEFTGSKRIQNNIPLYALFNNFGHSPSTNTDELFGPSDTMQGIRKNIRSIFGSMTMSNGYNEMPISRIFKYIKYLFRFSSEEKSFPKLITDPSSKKELIVYRNLFKSIADGEFPSIPNTTIPASIVFDYLLKIRYIDEEKYLLVERAFFTLLCFPSLDNLKALKGMLKFTNKLHHPVPLIYAASCRTYKLFSPGDASLTGNEIANMIENDRGNLPDQVPLSPVA
ncbi:MAG: hypothetical protein CL816_08540 [Coxiellaceae bacterium]|nr:hypothetical protein [Coxiellaceae bacterium]|tara:strand:+ start:3515 stop:5104 length:1590 start_codon:yes stop_codon:yes gene_type:complete